MKLSVEEKAKAYDKALAHTKLLLKTVGNATLGNLVLKNEFENMFPELKIEESEDERIRKDIIYHIKNCDDTIDEKTEKRMIAWLENRGEQKPWSEEDEERYESCLQKLGTGNPEQPETINSKWFKEHVHPKPQWKPSEEQLSQLYYASTGVSYSRGTLLSLLEQLRELKE